MAGGETLTGGSQLADYTVSSQNTSLGWAQGLTFNQRHTVTREMVALTVPGASSVPHKGDGGSDDAWCSSISHWFRLNDQFLPFSPPHLVSTRACGSQCAAT